MDVNILIFEIISIYALGLWSVKMVFIHICLGCNANVELGLVPFCDSQIVAMPLPHQILIIALSHSIKNL
jgi:hypothetical protein